MTGSNTLRVHLGSVEHSMTPLIAASFHYKSSEPRNLDGLEQLLIEHLADVENTLAHVRRMQIANGAG